MNNRIEALTKMLDLIADTLHILKNKPTSEIQALFHRDVTLALHELVAYAETIEYHMSKEVVS